MEVTKTNIMQIQRVDWSCAAEAHMEYKYSKLQGKTEDVNITPLPLKPALPPLWSPKGEITLSEMRDEVDEKILAVPATFSMLTYHSG
jgi:hypothetical protein